MRRPHRLLCLGAALAITACSKSLQELPRSPFSPPPPAQVQSVLFFIGDAGYADDQRDPILHVLRSDIEHWSAALARDSAVQVVFLGDIVYPVGLRPAEHPSFAHDSAIVQSQVNLLAGPNARRFGTRGYFVAGNHDWGEARNHTGVRRLTNLEEFLERRRAGGVHVQLEPKAGEPGPTVVDYGSTRLLLFDTAWWLLSRDDSLKRGSFLKTRGAIEAAGGRNVIVAGHHPFFSASSHGGLVPFWRAIGIRYVLARSGALLQDLNSIAYRELLGSMANAFEAGRPLLFAGGHDHSLQIIESSEVRTPRFTAVVGSASKSSKVGTFKGLTYRDNAPGYMRMITHRDGRVDLYVIAAPDADHLKCADADNDARQTCMRERSAAFRITHAQRLK